MKDSEKLHLKKGDKLIVVKKGHDLGMKLNYVYTFSNWYTPELALMNNPYYRNHPQFVEFLNKGVYFQVKELMDLGYFTHNFDIDNFEFYNPLRHQNAIIMSSEKYVELEVRFREKHTEYLTKRNYEKI